MSQVLSDWLSERPFTLTLSSGFFGFFAHTGVLTALLERDLIPHRLTGSSAGALVAGCWASGADIALMKQKLFALQKQDFWDPFPGLGLLRGHKFRQLLGELLQCRSFADCKVPLAVSAWNGLSQKTEVLTEGELVTAIYASCAVPFLFQPVWIKGKPMWDGGIKDRHGLAATDSQERVLYHHLSSRSPWRSKNSRSLKMPVRDNLAALAIHGLPRSGPDKLAVGPEAYQKAYESTLKALDMPLDNQRHIELGVA